MKKMIFFFFFPVLLVREKTCEDDCIGFNTHNGLEF